MMELTGKNSIAGKYSSSNTSLFRAIDPKTGKELDQVYSNASPSEIDDAVENAAASFQEYRNVSGSDKAKFLESIAAEILNDEERLLNLVDLETGLGQGRLKNELKRTIHQIDLFVKLLREGSWVNARIDVANPETSTIDVRTMQRPIGPIAVFGASNFPLAFSVAGGDTISALAAGCTVVCKAHPAHPGTSELVATAINRAIQKTSMPAGIFSMVHGNNNDVGMHLVQHPLIQAVAFTGSFAGGKAIFDAAVKRPQPIPVFAEMGSTNPVFILPGALNDDGEKIAKQLASSVLLGAGQFCTNPGIIFVNNSAHEHGFVDQLKQEIKITSSCVMLTPGIASSYNKGIEKLLKVPGVSLLAKGADNGSTGSSLPHVFQSDISSFLNNPNLEEEVFGPSTILFRADDKTELIAAATRLQGHLTATVIGNDQDLDEYAELIRILEQKAGRLIINGYPTGVQVSHSMVHGGPFPATTDSRTTSVGSMAIYRFTRAVCYQNFPDRLLPAELRNDNPGGIWRMINGSLRNDAI